jgi:hypothetical protein
MKCASCGQDDENPCPHLLNDPVLSPEAQLAIFRQFLFQQPAKPQSAAEQPDQNKS